MAGETRCAGCVVAVLGVEDLVVDQIADLARESEETWSLGADSGMLCIGSSSVDT